ncbi:MAG: hypothetical protein ACR2MX_08425 [Cyclobacteriaceae bacterium]
MASDNQDIGPADIMYQTHEADLDETPAQEEEVTPIEPAEEEVETTLDVEEEAETLDSDEEGDEPDIYQIGDLEATVDDFQNWKEAFDKRESMQADYTRKTMAVADERKALEAKVAETAKQSEALQNHIDRLESMGLQQLSAEEMEQLRDTDPSEYLKVKEQQEAAQKAIQTAKADRDKANSDKEMAVIAQEQQKLVESFPKWLDDKGQQTEQYKKDMGLMTDYLTSIGYTNEEMAKLENHKAWVVAYDAARYREIEKNSASTVKRVKQAPKTVKPTLKKKTKTKQIDPVAVFYGT